MTAPTQAAREHFDWAMARAMDHVEADRPHDALVSLIADLNRHDGTVDLMTPLLTELFVGEIFRAGTAGARSFLEGLTFPDDEDESSVDGG